MENYLTQITNYLLTQSWQIAALAVVIAAASLALKNKSAHVRYLLWLIVLAKCLVPPLLTVPLAVLPQEKPAMALETMDTTVAESPALPSAPPATALVPTLTEKPAKVTIHQWLGFGWIVGVAAFVIFAVIKALRTNLWLWRQRKPLPQELQMTIERAFCNYGTLPRLWLIKGIGQPFVWGLLRGGIYLPADFVKVNSAEHRRGVLGHELGHILRFDAAVNILQIIAQAVFWFHPFVWWANRKIRAEREKCCDEMAIARLGAEAKDYSSAIVNILICEHESTRPVPSLAVAGPVKNIEERIKTMLRPGKKFYKHPSLGAAAVVLMLALLTVPTALVLTARAEVKPGTKTLPERKEKPAISLPEAAMVGDIDQIRLHLLIGTAVNAKDNKGRTALHHAARKGYVEIARLLIAHGADVNTRAGDEQTPLHHAASRGRREMAELLILQGADVNARDRNGQTPLSRAMHNKGGGREMVEFLTSKGAIVPALHLAAHRGQLEEIRENLGDRATVDARDEGGRTLLHYAASAGQSQVVELLIARGADVDAKDKSGETPLYYAADAGWRNMVELLIADGADVNIQQVNRNTPLHEAAGAGSIDVAELLIAHGANPDAKDRKGYTPLHETAWWTDPSTLAVAKLLLDKGADVNARATWDGTPLTDAADSNNLPLAELLVDRGANVNATCPFGCTCLHHAVSSKNVAEFLITKGADVNIKDNNGRTPLNWAVRRRHKDVVELLIAKGADVNAKNNEGETPLSIAEEKGHTEIVELLRKHGAKE